MGSLVIGNIRVFFVSSRRLHTRCALVTGVQTCALPISWTDVPIDPTASIDNLIAWEVHYPTYPEIEIPDEWLRRYVEGLRSNLTLAVALATRLRSEPYFMLRTLAPNGGDDEHDFGINHASARTEESRVGKECASK